MNVTPTHRKPLLCAAVLSLVLVASAARSEVLWNGNGSANSVSVREFLKPGLVQVANVGTLVAQVAPLSVQALNEAAKVILSRFHTPPSQTAIVEIKAVNVDAQRTVSVSGRFQATKKAQNGKEAKIAFSEISYAYNNGKPSFSGKGTAQLDLLSVYPQDVIDENYESIVDLVKDQLSRSFGEYAHAVDVEKSITANPGTSSENKPPVKSIKLSVKATVKFERLPPSTAKAVPFKWVSMEIASPDLKNFTASLTGESNVNSRYFQQGQVGLKETLEKIQAQEPEAVRNLQSYVKQIKEAVDGFVK